VHPADARATNTGTARASRRTGACAAVDFVGGRVKLVVTAAAGQQHRARKQPKQRRALHLARRIP
jgi:hypothetical protein